MEMLREQGIRVAELNVSGCYNKPHARRQGNRYRLPDICTNSQKNRQPTGVKREKSCDASRKTDLARPVQLAIA
jgi:hypothetical protein